MNIQNPFKFAQKNAYWAVTLVLVLTSLGSYAQGQSNNSGVMMFVVGLVAIVAVLVLLVAIYALQVIKKLEVNQPAKVEGEEEPSLWKRFLEIANNRVSVEKEADILMDHNYDGIRELDNHLPPWWKWLFYITIVWGAIYLVGHHFTGWFPLQEEEYELAMLSATTEKEARLAANTEAGGFDISKLVYTADASMIEAGKKTFARNCIACHGSVGQGNAVGPNLTDEYWLHGGSIINVFNTIKDGVPDKGMISWESQLSPTDIRDVSTYVISLVGTNPPDAKKPQGTIYEAGASNENTETPAAAEEEVEEVAALVATADLEEGKSIYANNCAACHLADGGGVVGPNLTDKYWKEGNGTKETIKKTIVEGVAGSAMVAWNGILSESEVEAVTNFVVSLKGTTPAAPKAPEGDLYE